MTKPTIDPISYNAGIEAAAQTLDWRADVCRRDAALAAKVGCTISDSGGTIEYYAALYAGLADSIRSLHLPEPQTAPASDELWSAIRDRDARINVLYAAMKEACDLLTERKQGGHAHSPNHNARLVLEAAIKDRPTAAPADAERLALAAKLRVAAKIAGNPVHDDIMRAAEYLEKLRAGGWREDMQS